MAKDDEAQKRLMLVTPSPHLHGGESIPVIMWSVVGALVPAVLAGVWVFGWPTLWVIAWCVAAAVGTEAGLQKWLKKPVTVRDGSAALTGLLLAMTLPPSTPWWIAVIGGAFAIGICKTVYGGLGQNIFNPALVSRIFLLIAFPAQLTSWSAPRGVDAFTGATPLGFAREGVMLHGRLPVDLASYASLGLGSVSGCLGEVSAIALLLGAAYLFYKGYITWAIPASFLAATALITGAAHIYDPSRYLSPVFHLLSGGLILGAFFMATDMVTSPVSKKGQLIFGAGCGALTAIIRLWGGYPEGVSFAIVLMNATVPLIDRYTTPLPFGRAEALAAAKRRAAS